MTDLKTLAERVEGLTGPCRETDAEIAIAVGRNVRDELFYQGDWYDRFADAGAYETLHRYTASLDAVLALIGEKLPGASWSCGFVHPDQSDTDDPPGAWGRVCTDHYGHEDEHIRSGATPALALLAAALRALGESHDR